MHNEGVNTLLPILTLLSFKFCSFNFVTVLATPCSLAYFLMVALSFNESFNPHSSASYDHHSLAASLSTHSSARNGIIIIRIYLLNRTQVPCNTNHLWWKTFVVVTSCWDLWENFCGCVVHAILYWLVLWNFRSS